MLSLSDKAIILFMIIGFGMFLTYLKLYIYYNKPLSKEVRLHNELIKLGQHSECPSCNKIK